MAIIHSYLVKNQKSTNLILAAPGPFLGVAQNAKVGDKKRESQALGELKISEIHEVDHWGSFHQSQYANSSKMT